MNILPIRLLTTLDAEETPGDHLDLLVGEAGRWHSWCGAMTLLHCYGRQQKGTVSS
jgi:hypothetical protein